ncbi:MAG TPA: MaoC family dehydratase N-terminal domain-containing protein [Chloroflexota bacterium]|jgi:acyl dehydratase
MADDAPSVLTDEVMAWVGRSSDTREFPEPIATSDVRRYLDATGDDNPLWRDEAYARAQGYRARLVPPLFVAALTRRIPVSHSPEDQVFWEHKVPILTGYTNTRNAGTELEFLAPIYVGDRISVQTHIVDITERRGRTGLGIFITRILEFRNQDGVPVIRRRQSLGKYPAFSVVAEAGRRDDG